MWTSTKNIAQFFSMNLQEQRIKGGAKPQESTPALSPRTASAMCCLSFPTFEKKDEWKINTEKIEYFFPFKKKKKKWQSSAKDVSLI